MTKYLFLGGSADGQWIDVHFEGQPWTIVHPIEIGPGWHDGGDSGRPMTVDTQREVYHPQKVVGNSQRFTVYALDGWRGDDIMDRLIYGPRDPRGEPRTQKLSNVQRYHPDTRDPAMDGDLEARMIADMARKAHIDGLRFVDWPKCERRRYVYDNKEQFGVRDITGTAAASDFSELRVTVNAVPR